MSFTGKATYAADSGFKQLHRDDMVFSAGTTAVASDEPKIDLTKISSLLADSMSFTASSFVGIPVRVDHELRGMEYNIAVSPELLAAIQKAEVSEPRQLVDKLNS